MMRAAALASFVLACSAASVAQSFALPATVTGWRVVRCDDHDDVLLGVGRSVVRLRGGRTPNLDAPFSLPDDVAALDVRSNPPVLVAIGNGGVRRWALDGPRPFAPLEPWSADVVTLPVAPDRVPWTALAVGETVVLPHVRGALAFAGDGRAATIDLPLERGVSITGGDPLDRIVAELRVPTIAAADLDGDGREDVAAIRDQRVDAFGRDDDGAWRPTALGRIDRPWRAPSTRLLRLVVPARLADLDRDGHADLIDVDANAGRIRVTFGPLVGAGASPVVRTARLQGLIVGVERVGSRLVLFTTDAISLARGARIFLSQSLPVGVAAIDVDAERTLSAAKPIGRIRIPIAVGGSVTRAKKARPRTDAVALADLDADGHVDLVVASRDSVRVHAGGPRRFARAPTTVLRDRSIGSITAVLAADLDGDGRTEVVAHGADRDGKPRLWVLRPDR